MVLAAAACGLVWATFRPVFEASAWLRIEDRIPFIAFESKDADQSKSFVQTQLELLRSPMVLGPVVGVDPKTVNPKVDPKAARLEYLVGEADPVSWLASQIKVKQVGTSDLYTVSFACAQAEAAAFVVNAVVDEYLRSREEEDVKRLGRVTDLLDREMARRTEGVKQLRENVRELAKQATGKDIFGPKEDSAKPRSHPLGDLENRMLAAEVDESVLRAKLTVLEAIVLKLPQSAIDRTVAENPQAQRAAAALAERKSALAELEAKLTEGKKDPKYQRAEKAVAAEEDAMKQLKAALHKQAKDQLEASVNGKREEELAALRVDMESRRVVKESLKARYESELKSELKNVQQLSGNTLTLKFKQDELARDEKVLELISERILRLKTEQGAPSRVVRLKQADVPTAPEQRYPYRNLILALLAGFCLPFGLAILKEQMARRITDSECLEQQSHLAVIGEIARLPSQRGSSRRLGPRQRRAVLLFEESMDALRTHLFFSAHSETRVLALTSAINHEGKTSVAVQLAVSLARAGGELTLIIDGDMRSPSVHRVLQVPLEPGLSKVLAGECDLRDAIVKLDEKIHVLPAGKLHASPHALVGNGAMDSLWRSIPAEYRYVILDTPPILAASEALVLAKAADAVLMCVMRDVSRASQVKKAAEKLATVGGRLIGTVLSGIPTRHYVARYGSYQYYDDSTG